MFLRSWFPKKLTTLRIPNGLSSGEIASLKAEHVDAYLNGKPFSRMTQRRRTFPSVNANTVAYADGFVTWISILSDKLYLHNIESGQDVTRAVGHGELMSHVGVSAFMVAAITSFQDCYIWRTPRTSHCPHVFELVGANAKCLSVSGGVLAILHEQSPNTSDAELTVWSQNTGAVHLLIKMQQPLLEKQLHDPTYTVIRTVLIDSTTRSVLLFENLTVSQAQSREHSQDESQTGSQDTSEDKIQERFLCFSCMSLEGRIRNRGFIEVPPCGQDLWQLEAPLLQDGLVTAWYAIKVPSEATLFCQVIYDLSAAKLRWEKTEIKDWRKFIYLDQTFLFKRALYCFQSYRDNLVVDLERRNISRANLGKPFRVHFNINPGRFPVHFNLNRRQGPVIRGDETFIVCIHWSGFIVWCFDKHVRMARQDRYFP